MRYQTEQEKFWAGSFGQEYIQRNNSSQLHASNLHFFSRILNSLNKIDSLMEFGANIGMNIKALRQLLPDINASAIEINTEAYNELKKICNGEVLNESILSLKLDKKYDLVFTKGVMIHLNPEKLHNVYNLLYSSSKQYILIAEYYNPVPITIPYRGHADKLFKRDFAGEMLDMFPDLKLVDYGFSYHKDPHFPQDDISWFLLEKRDM